MSFILKHNGQCNGDLNITGDIEIDGNIIGENLKLHTTS